jgi:hypothetical protein
VIIDVTMGERLTHPHDKGAAMTFLLEGSDSRSVRSFLLTVASASALVADGLRCDPRWRVGHEWS